MRTVSPDAVPNGIKLDAMLCQQSLVLLQSVHQILLVQPLLPAPGRLRRNHPALHTGLDTVGTRLALVAAYFALLTEHAARPSGEFDDGRVSMLREMML